eukprot:4147970-Pyramimonas_sp.AAC.1
MRRREVGSPLRVANGRQARLSSKLELTTYIVLEYLLIHVISNPWTFLLITAGRNKARPSAPERLGRVSASVGG